MKPLQQILLLTKFKQKPFFMLNQFKIPILSNQFIDIFFEKLDVISKK